MPGSPTGSMQRFGAEGGARMDRESQLTGQTLLVIGGSSGIGLETARRARGEGAKVILTARNPERVHRVGSELEASIAAFDATDLHRLASFFEELPTPVDHVLVSGPRPHYWPLLEFDIDEAQRDPTHLLLPLDVARVAVRSASPQRNTLFFWVQWWARRGRGRSSLDLPQRCPS